MRSISKIIHPFTFIFTFFLFQNAAAQVQLGLRLDNYAGVNGITLNPTAGIHNPLGWHVNIVSAGSFFSNDYAFIRNSNVISTLKNAENISFPPEAGIDFSRKSDYVMDFSQRNQVKYVSTAHFVTLPSLQINLENGNSFGLFFQQRAALVSRNIPILADPYAMQKMGLNVRTAIPSFNITGATWGEMGLNYAHNFGSDTEGGLSVGATLKVLRPNQAFFVQNREGTAVTRLTKDSTRVDAVNVGVGLTTNFNDNALNSNGLGVGLDIGATFVLPTGEWDERPYSVRMSAAILDIGRFSLSKNAQIHEVKLTEPLKIDAADYQNLDLNDPTTDALNRFSRSTFGQPNATLRGNNFALSLPTSFVLQADFAVLPTFFINGLLVQRLPSANRGLSRDNVLAITPRFETRWFGASAPLSILNYQQVNLGLAARLAFLTIGTDNLGSFLGQKRLYGTDIYVALTINAFKIGKLGGGKNSYRGGGGKEAKCYRF